MITTNHHKLELKKKGTSQVTFFSYMGPSPTSSTVASCLFIVLLLLGGGVYNATAARGRLPANVSVPAIIIFGDSIMDTGNNNNLPTAIKCNFPPYGIDFHGGHSTGRFCDGKIPSDIIAEELGITESIPAYLDPNVQISDLLTGVSFASGGAGFDPLTAKLVSVVTLSQQLQYYQEYVSKMKAMVGEERTNFIISNAMFYVVAGSDDIANTYFLLRARSLYDVPSYTDLMSDYASDFVQKLYKLGARRIGVFSAPPIGCVPSQRTAGGGLDRECAEDRNQAALLFNSKLQSKLSSLAPSMPNTNLVYIDVYTSLSDLINNPQKYGFEVAEKGCCGTGAIEVAILCNKLTPVTCPNIGSHIFWDSYHPTEKAYRVITTQLLDQYAGALVA
ncbi:GDSL esterase/lipase EXL3 [Linum perenne]